MPTTSLASDRLAVAVSRGEVTLCFTDIEDSTPLAERLPDDYPAMLATHRELLRQRFAAHDGIEILAEGEEFFEAFESATSAVLAAIEAQRALAEWNWPGGAAVRVRIGLHTGSPMWTPGGLVGLDVHRAARVAAAGYGGQILVSGSTFDATERLREDVEFAYLGVHRLKGLAQQERLYQVVAPGLPRHFPPPRTLRDASVNLPVELTALLGREIELANLGRLLSRRDLRLITITGPAGTGKTRLAVEAAAQASLEFRDGVCFVGLASIASPDAVPAQIARALQVPGSSEGIEQLVIHLAGKELLLVVDNFEHLLPASGDLAELLVRCPGLKLLVTCREPLRLRGETEFPLRPLGLPPQGTQDPELVARSPAVRLFVERAAAVRPGLTLSEENVASIARICRQLDGLPLAIELVAARSRLLSPGAILERFASLLDVASHGSRDLPGRHQSLRHAIGWSYNLLPETERRVFRRVSVFVGGFSLEAAQAVVGGTPLEGGLLDELEALVARNLLRGSDDSGELRFSMLETIKEYGMERLEEAGEAQKIRTLHLEYFNRWALESGSRDGQASYIAALDLESDNVRAALQFSLDSPARALSGLSLAVAAGMFWWQRSAHEGSLWISQLLAVADDPPSAIHARALYWLAFLGMQLRPPSEVVALTAECVARAQEGPPTSTTLVMALNIHAEALIYVDRLEDAFETGKAALSAATLRGDARLIGMTLWPLGVVAAARGDPTAAREFWTRSCEEFERTGDELLLATPLSALARLALREGDLPAAERLISSSLEILARTRDLPRLTEVLSVLAEIHLCRANTIEAHQCVVQGLQVAIECGGTSRIVSLLFAAAKVCLARGHWEDAATLAGAGAALARGPDSALAQPSEALAIAQPLRQEMTDEALAIATQAGEQMGRMQAIEAALEAMRRG